MSLLLHFIELVPVWRRAGIPRAVSRSVGRSCTPPGTALAWSAQHDSGLSSAASLSFLLTEQDSWWENRVKSKRKCTKVRERMQFPIILWPYWDIILSKRFPCFPAVSLNHLFIWFQWLHSTHTGTQLGHAVCVKATVNTAMKTAILHPTHESAAPETP